MSEIRVDRSLVELVKPVELPDGVSQTWVEAYLDPIRRWLPIADATYREWPERPNCGHFYGGSYWYAIETAYPILTYAVAYRAATLPGVGPTVPLDALLHHAVGAIRYLCFTHVSGPPECVRETGDSPSSRTKWGDTMDGFTQMDPFFMASQTGSAVAHLTLGAWLLWEHLDDETRQLVINVAAWYADRWCDERPRVGTYENTLTEENGWTAQGLDAAAGLLRGHPSAEKWRKAADKWLANITVTPYDMSRNKSELQGQPVAAWTVGATSHPDFSTENHGFVHPSYLASAIGFAGASLLSHRLAGLEEPELVRFNRRPIYETMKKLAEDDGPMLAVQGMDWWYATHATLLPISTVSAHTVMSLLFGDPHAAYIERLCVGRVRQIMDSLGDGHLCVPDPQHRRINQWQSFRTYERSAMVGFAGSFLLHWLMGDGAEPCSGEQFRAWQRGVHAFPHGGFVTRKGKRCTASFSWRNRPVVVVQPEGGTWVVTPHFASLSGTYRCEPASECGMRTIRHSVSEDGKGFAALCSIEREDGRLVQDLALIAPDDHVAFFFDRTTAAQAVRVREQRSGEVGVRNESYPELGELAPGRRIILTESGRFTSESRFGGEDEWFRTDQTRWANVDDRIGYVILGSKGIAYQAHHDYPRYRGMEDFLLLSYSDQSNEYAPGDVVSSLAVAIFPNQRGADTQVRTARVIRAVEGQTSDALLTPGYLAAVNLASEPAVHTLQFASPDWVMLPVPEGCTVTWDGALTCEASLDKFRAHLFRCGVQLSRSAHWRATAAPGGRAFIELMQNQPAEVTVTVDGHERTLALAPGRIVAV